MNVKGMDGVEHLVILHKKAKIIANQVQAAAESGAKEVQTAADGVQTAIQHMSGVRGMKGLEQFDRATHPNLFTLA